MKGKTSKRMLWFLSAKASQPAPTPAPAAGPSGPL